MIFFISPESFPKGVNKSFEIVLSRALGPTSPSVKVHPHRSTLACASQLLRSLGPQPVLFEGDNDWTPRRRDSIVENHFQCSSCSTLGMYYKNIDGKK